MTNFPTSVVNFLQLQDGVDNIVAADPNNRGNEITALETMLGAMGYSQAYSESYKNLLIDYSYGCQVLYDSTTAFYVNPGEIVINDGAGNFAFRRNTTQISLTLSAVLDTGTLAAGTTYYIYAVANASGTTFTCVASTNSTTPSGHTMYRQIGVLTTDGSKNIITGTVQGVLLNGQATVENFGVSTSAYQVISLGALKIAFGTAADSGGTFTITNLPFSAATSYVVFTSREAAGSGAYQSQAIEISAKSASSFTAYSNLGDSKTVDWFAIGV